MTLSPDLTQLVQVTLICLTAGVVAAVSYIGGRKEGKRAGYWTGRLSGWKDCEDMVIRRGIEAGYDKQELWEKLIQ
jgi:hypothetical protein